MIKKNRWKTIKEFYNLNSESPQIDIFHRNGHVKLTFSVHFVLRRFKAYGSF